MLLGAALFAAVRLSAAGAPASASSADSAAADRQPAVQIVFSRADLERLRSQWRTSQGRPPSAEREEMLLRDAIEEEMLVREAIRLGMHRGDRVVDGWLRRLGEFLHLPADETAVAVRGEVDVAKLRELGLDTSDEVVRRYLAHMMRMALAGSALVDLPDDATLRSHLTANASHFARPELFDLEHVYFSRDRWGEEAHATAEAALAAMRTGDSRSNEIKGDPFHRGRSMRGATRGAIDRSFGAGFGDAVASAEVGRWSGPFASSYGLHLVRVLRRHAGGQPILSEVRGRVLHHYLYEQRERRLTAAMERLRARYVVSFEVETPVAEPEG